MSEENEKIQEVLLDLILDNAISFEEESKEFYRIAALKSISDDTKTILQQLALKEDGHIQKLRHLKKSDLNERLLKIEISDLPAIHGLNRKEWFITAQDDMKRILEIALERESTAENFYSGLYRKANDGTIRKLFFLLANEEKQHFEDIKRLQSKLLNQQGEM